MWVRRCGAPPKWASRAKVILTSFFTAACGMTIYKFMQLADVNYLDLDSPLGDQVTCMRSWPLRHQTGTWLSAKDWEDWFKIRWDPVGYMETYACQPDSMKVRVCGEVDVSLRDLKRNLGVPFSQEFLFRNDFLEMYSYFFLSNSVWLWIMVLCHDLTLLSVRNRNYILDWTGVNKSFPRLVRLFRLTGAQGFCSTVCGPCTRRTNTRRACAAGCVLFAPVLFAWGISVFLLACLPMVILSFVSHPLRLSRICIFLLCICMAAYGIVLAVHMIVMLSVPDFRPAYAITWDSGVAAASGCICGCSYHLASKGLSQILLMGGILTFQGLMLAFRSLKGLRRSNWANLMSVTFAIPLTVYAVEWTSADGQPIRFRKEGEAVQGELAFDPFALMDEQPDSAKTTVNLRPVHLHAARTASGREQPANDPKRHLEGPRIASTSTMAIVDSEYIGCCGFPCKTGGFQGRLQGEGDSDSDEEVCTVHAKALSGLRLPSGLRSHGSRSRSRSRAPSEEPSEVPDESAVCSPQCRKLGGGDGVQLPREGERWLAL